MIWFTADTHFGHDSIRRYCKRPFNNIDEMDEAIIKSWNKVVSEKDDVYHLGDFTFRNAKAGLEILRKLKGHIYLIPGNHDGTARQIRYRFMNGDEIPSNKRTCLVKEIIVRVEEPNRKIILCHYPLHEWNGSHHGFWHLHGHSHGRTIKKRNRMDVGIDCNNFKPVSYEQVKEYMTKLEREF